MHNSTLSNNLSKEIFNISKKFLCKVSRPHQFNMREILRGMILSGSTFLSRIIRSNGVTIKERKAIERLSKSLEKLPLDDLTSIHAKSLGFHYRKEPVLILSDGGDIQKPYAKKMEKVGSAVDGSNGHKVGKGYLLHSLVVSGLHTKELTPLALRLYSTLDEKFKSVFCEEQENFELVREMVESSPFDRIVVEDRGCDDEKRFLYFVKNLQASFVTRIHAGAKSRNFLAQNINGEWETMKIKELGEQLKEKADAPKSWWNQKIKKQLVSRIAYTKVYLPNHKELPLYAVFCYTEGFDEPLVILTDLRTKSNTKAWKHFFYYKKRWEVENFYRGIKQQFGAEKFLVLKLKTMQSMMFLIMLSYVLILKMKQNDLEFFGMLLIIFEEFCENRQIDKNHHFSILAFLRSEIIIPEQGQYYRFYSQRFRKFRYFSTKYQLRIFDFRKIW